MKRLKFTTFVLLAVGVTIIGIMYVSKLSRPLCSIDSTSTSPLRPVYVQISATTTAPAPARTTTTEEMEVSTQAPLPQVTALISHTSTVQNRIAIDIHENRSWESLNSDIVNFSPGIKAGGSWIPDRAHHLAMIIPYRNRDEHLKVFLNHIHPFLQRQKLMYTIFVIEQQQHAPFNRGLLMNVGYTEAMKRDDYGCLILHDVDNLPEDNRLDYKCAAGNKARQLAVSRSKFNYTIQYPNYFGGVTAVRPDQFKKANGFPNTFFGWGAEDDEFLHRLQRQGISPERPPAEIARYTTLPHKKAKPNPGRFKLLKNHKYDTDGLNSLQYEIIKTELRPLYTWILISLNETAILKGRTP